MMPFLSPNSNGSRINSPGLPDRIRRMGLIWLLAIAGLAALSNCSLAQDLSSFDFDFRNPLAAFDDETNGTQARRSEQPFFGFDTPLMTDLLDFQNQQSEKQIWLIESGIDYPSSAFIVGTQLRSSLLLARTNRDNRFSYLGRFPPDFRGRTASDARLLQGNAAFATHYGSMFHGYFETLFSDVFTFPTFNQGSFQVRQAYVAIGDFQQSPLYMFVGKKNVSFGDMGTLSPFSQSMVWHYFSPLAEGIGAGYSQGGLDLTVTALNGGRGIRVARSAPRGQLSNFAVNGSWSGMVDEVGIKLGLGYLHGTIYDANVAEHINFAIAGDRNPAWNANAGLSWRQWDFAAEYTTTLNPWPVTDTRVQAYRTEACYRLPNTPRPTRLSLSWSEGLQGPSGSEFEFNRQLVLGSAVKFNRHALFTTEYVLSSGFAPLIDITTASDRSVRQHSAVFGLVLVL